MPADKSPMESKKFRAYLLAETTWKAIVFTGLLVVAWQVYNNQEPSIVLIWFLMAVVIIAGFIEAGYLGGVTWLDSFTDVARIAVNAEPPGLGGSADNGPSLLTEEGDDVGK